MLIIFLFIQQSFTKLWLFCCVCHKNCMTMKEVFLNKFQEIKSEEHVKIELHDKSKPYQYDNYYHTLLGWLLWTQNQKWLCALVNDYFARYKRIFSLNFCVWNCLWEYHKVVKNCISPVLPFQVWAVWPLTNT